MTLSLSLDLTPALASWQVLNYIPMAALAGIMIVVVLHTFKWFSLPMLAAAFLSEVISRRLPPSPIALHDLPPSPIVSHRLLPSPMHRLRMSVHLTSPM